MCNINMKWIASLLTRRPTNQRYELRTATAIFLRCYRGFQQPVSKFLLCSNLSLEVLLNRLPIVITNGNFFVSDFHIIFCVSGDFVNIYNVRTMDS